MYTFRSASSGAPSREIHYFRLPYSQVAYNKAGWSTLPLHMRFTACSDMLTTFTLVIN